MILAFFGSPQELFREIILKSGLCLLDDVLLSFFSIFSSGGHSVQWSETILAILEERHTRNISMKSFCNQPTCLGEDII